MGREIELGVREEGIENPKSNYSALKKRLSTGTVSGTGEAYSRLGGELLGQQWEITSKS